MNLLLIRHGQSQANVEGRMQGWLDSPLSDTGRAEADALVRRLVRDGWPISAIYASDLLRAAQTAERLAAALGLPVVLDRRLREYGIGQLTGVVYRDIEFLYPDIWRGWHASNDLVPVPGEEGWPAMNERVSAALADLLAAHDTRAAGTAVAVVTHGGTIRTLLSHLLQLNVGGRLPFEFRNGSLTVVDLGRGQPVLTLLNDICHLNHDH